MQKHFLWQWHNLFHTHDTFTMKHLPKDAGCQHVLSNQRHRLLHPVKKSLKVEESKKKRETNTKYDRLNKPKEHISPQTPMKHTQNKHRMNI